MVIPSSPEESELWELVSRQEMPPPDSPTGPLSAAQKEAIRAWIAAGAPTTTSSKSGEAPAPEPEHQEDDSAVAAPSPTLSRLGAFHVVLVHFPIALLIAAAIGELYSGWRGSRPPMPAVHFCVLLGSAGALAATALGWLQAENGYGVGMPQVLGLHRWIGTATALWTVGTALLSVRDERRGVRSPWFRAWLFLGATLVGVSGHLGGVLVHGEDYFTGR